MNTVHLPCILVLIALPTVSPGGDAVSLGPGDGVVLETERENPCDPPSYLLANDDGSFEDAGTWHYGGVVPPDYGAFAEGYHSAGSGRICGIQAGLTTLSGQFQGQTLDAYVYASDGANPAAVLSVTVGVQISQPANWPHISFHDIAVGPVDAPPEFFVGWWGNWPGQPYGWLVSQDLDGLGGMPRTKIAPGIGYPTGWQDPSVVWGPIQAHGIRVYILEEATPARSMTWGAIKSLY